MYRRVAAIGLLSATVLAAPAHASGYYLSEQSAKEIGRAFSGGAAAADDASTVFYNPAGMTELGQVNISTNATLLWVHSNQRDTGSTRSIPGVPTLVPTGGNSGGNPFANPVFIPAGYASFRINQSPVWVGLGINSPFGLKDQYSSGFFGRYDSTKSDVKTVDIQPSIGIKLSDSLSIGGGVDIEQIDVKLRSALPNASPLLPDGQLAVTGDDMSFGWNLGVLATLGAARFGANYRSGIKHKLNGEYAVSGLVAPLALGNVGAFATAPLSLPSIATVSAMYGVGKRARLMASGKWFNWSTFREIAVTPLGGATQVSQQNYKDSYSGSLGAEYDITPALTLRAGGMYETTPTVDAYRSTRVPDGNRTWASGGMSFRLNPRTEFNLSYAHVFVATEALSRHDSFYAGTPAAIDVVTNSVNTGSADEVSSSVTFRL